MQHIQTSSDVANWLRQRVTGDLLCDSRLLQPGDGFVAWPGGSTDGRNFVRAALNAGAVAAVVEREGAEAFAFDDERVVSVQGLKAQAGAIASAYHAEPSAALNVIAITGTNGKTSTAWWVAQLLSAAHMPCALVGTLGIGRPPLAGEVGHALVSTGLTTPDPVLLQSRLRAMVAEGTKACAIEASSIGLVEGRLNATTIRVGVFSNFTQDHLDFHGSMERYWEAKASLFDWAGMASAVINVDDPKGITLHATLMGRPMDLWTVAVDESGADSMVRLTAQALRHTKEGVRFEVVERDATGNEVARHGLSLPLIGRYNVSNVICALACARALGVGLEQAVQACGSLSPVPGRMERAGQALDGQPLVLVDYAHTPDALEKALQALQPVTAERGGALWVVIGCGGDRDASKRPVMAAVAEAQASSVVLTSDNPRSEIPESILDQMASGLKHRESVVIEVDRAAAIAHTVRMAQPNDVVLIAGKGHEDYQEIQGVKRPFSDLAHAGASLAAREQVEGRLA